MKAHPLVLAITGASGAIYSVRLLQMLLSAGREVHLVISPSGAAVIRQELGIELEVMKSRYDVTNLLRGAVPTHNPAVKATQDHLIERSIEAVGVGQLLVHGYTDYFTPIASGSFLTEAMVICPCSGSTLSGVVRSASENLIQRAAEVHLKERRPLIVVPRETPLSSFQIENMLRASQAGIVVMPAAPGWYHGVNELSDLVDFVVARVLDQLKIPHQLMKRWAT